MAAILPLTRTILSQHPPDRPVELVPAGDARRFDRSLLEPFSAVHLRVAYRDGATERIVLDFDLLSIDDHHRHRRKSINGGIPWNFRRNFRAAGNWRNGHSVDHPRCSSAQRLACDIARYAEE